jgi:hypothetical protein
MVGRFSPFAESTVVINDLGLLNGTVLCHQAFQCVFGYLEEEVTNV